MRKLLKNVTLLGVDCVDSDRLVLAADICQKDFEFGAVKLLTSLPSNHKDVVHIDPIASKEGYSDFIVRKLNDYVNTDFVLLIQYDGFILNPDAWSYDYLDYDYIGAPLWENNQYIVGNGGFSLRSKRLVETLKKFTPSDTDAHPEDWFICVTMRKALEERGMKFAPIDVARQFSFESNEKDGIVWNGQFGFHGLTWTDISSWLKQHPEYPIQNNLDSWALDVNERLNRSLFSNSRE